MEFKQICPDEVKTGSLVKLSFLPSTFKVIEITARGVDQDNLPFVCGYMQKQDGDLKMSFSYKESYSYLSFLNPGAMCVRSRGHLGYCDKYEYFKIGNDVYKAYIPACFDVYGHKLGAIFESTCAAWDRVKQLIPNYQDGI